MSISQTTTLSKPIPGERVPPETLAYFSARAKRHAYDLVIRELEESKISRTELARRLGMDSGQLSRTLGGPGNWTIDTASRLLFAISGVALGYRIDNPLSKPARNHAGASAALTYASQRDEIGQDIPVSKPPPRKSARDEITNQ